MIVTIKCTRGVALYCKQKVSQPLGCILSFQSEFTEKISVRKTFLFVICEFFSGELWWWIMNLIFNVFYSERFQWYISGGAYQASSWLCLCVHFIKRVQSIKITFLIIENEMVEDRIGERLSIKFKWLLLDFSIYQNSRETCSIVHLWKHKHRKGKH